MDAEGGSDHDERDREGVAVPEGRDRHAAARTALAGVALPDVQGHVHRHRGHASGATPQVVANPDEHPHEPVGEGRGPAPSAAPNQAVAFVAESSPGTGTKDEIGVSQSPWHRHVSPIFFLLLVVAGLMVGFVAFFLLPEVTHAVAG
jgi:hypothetical protein